MEDVVPNDENSGSGRMLKIRHEQRAFDMMKDLVQKFSKSGETVQDPFAGTLSSAKEVKRHSRFIEFDKEV